MNNSARLLGYVCALVLGVGAGIGLLYSMTQTMLPLPASLYQLFGIQKPQIIGFAPYWLLDKMGPPSQYPLTTFAYFALELGADGTIQKLVNAQEEDPGWRTFKSDQLQKRLQEVGMQRQSTSLLLQLNRQSTINALLADPVAHANTIVEEVMPLMRDHHISDLNLDIESFYYASPPAQAQFIQFIQTVHDGLQANKLGTLTIELTPAALTQVFLFDPAALGKIADTVVLMAYDYSYAGSLIAGPVAPLGGAGQTREFDVELAIQQAIKKIPIHKLILGIPLYGYEWETISQTPGAPTIPGSAATASNRRVTQLLRECATCQSGVDQTAQEPYVVLPDADGKQLHQVFYEDKASLAKKLDLAKQYHLGGVALWALGYEDPSLLEPLVDYKRTVLWR